MDISLFSRHPLSDAFSFVATAARLSIDGPLISVSSSLYAGGRERRLAFSRVIAFCRASLPRDFPGKSLTNIIDTRSVHFRSHNGRDVVFTLRNRPTIFQPSQRPALELRLSRSSTHEPSNIRTFLKSGYTARLAFPVGGRR